MNIKIFYIVVALLFGVLSHAKAQSLDQIDSTHLAIDTAAIKEKIKEEIRKPLKFALYSTALPGLGQYHNRKRWKIPIIYGGFVAFGAMISINHQAMMKRRKEIIYRNINDVEFYNPEFEFTSSANLYRNVASFRDNRDLSIILTIIWYGLNVADAAVDAHFSDFEVNDDLSLNISPKLIPTVDGKRSLGAGFTFSFKHSTKRSRF